LRISVYGLANEVEVKPAQAAFGETIVVQSFMTRQTNEDAVEMKFAGPDTADFVFGR
jgi:hypothetical protein